MSNPMSWSLKGEIRRSPGSRHWSIETIALDLFVGAGLRRAVMQDGEDFWANDRTIQMCGMVSSNTSTAYPLAHCLRPLQAVQMAWSYPAI